MRHPEIVVAVKSSSAAPTRFQKVSSASFPGVNGPGSRAAQNRAMKAARSAPVARDRYSRVSSSVRA